MKTLVFFPICGQSHGVFCIDQIRLWDLAAGKSMSTLTNHKKGVRAVACNSREFSFASASADNIKVWRFTSTVLFSSWPTPNNGGLIRFVLYCADLATFRRGVHAQLERTQRYRELAFCKRRKITTPKDPASAGEMKFEKTRQLAILNLIYTVLHSRLELIGWRHGLRRR